MYYFFVGTDAEIIKVFPVIELLRDRKAPFHLFLSGQHKLLSSPFLEAIQGRSVTLINPTSPNQSRIGHIVWFLKSFVLGVVMFLKTGLVPGGIGLVHGDTISTLLGTLLFRLWRVPVAHIEAGLRSHDIFDPFPEEINRVLVDSLSTYHYCSGPFYANYLKSIGKNNVISTTANTLYDVVCSSSQKHIDHMLSPQTKYAVFSLHRQSVVLDQDRFDSIIKQVLSIATPRLHVFFITHTITTQAIDQSAMKEKLTTCPYVLLSKRLPFDVFIQVLRNAEFIITDSGGNQEEAHFLGIPCLILRNKTERVEGVGKNALLAGSELEASMRMFVEMYSNFRQPPLQCLRSPSSILVEHLTTIK